MTHRPLIIGHRGAAGSEPENTMRSFRAACAAGADGIELDVFLSHDKALVVTHDLDTFRLTQHRHNVRKSSLEILRTLDFGQEERIPTLAEVFEEFLPRLQVINVEIKSTGFRTDGIEAELAKLIQKFGCEKQILISSFNPVNIYRAKKLLPQVRIGYLIEPKFSSARFHNRTIRWLKPDTLNLHPALKTNSATTAYFDMGIPLWMWSVDTEADWQYWTDQGVQAIITDHPGHLYSLLHPGSRRQSISDKDIQAS